MNSGIKQLFFILLALFSVSGYSKTGELKFVHFTNENGLPSSYIRSLCQDRYGFIWATSRSSICRFDGKYFKTFKATDDKGNFFDLWSTNVYSFNDSTFLTFTTDSLYYYFDFESECFRKHPLLNTTEIISDIQASKNGLWLIGNDKIHFLKNGSKEFLDFSNVIDFVTLEPNVSIINIREKNDILAALTSDNRLMVIDIQKKLQRIFNLPEGLISNEVVRFFEDQNNNVWIGTIENGLFQINLNSGHSVYFSEKLSGNRHLLHDLVHTIEEDHQGRVWIGTENGLCIWSPYTESFDYYQYDIHNPDGLNTNPIYDILCDRDGNMWLGTYFGGINFWSSNEEFFKVWQAGTGEKHIGGNAVSCITEDKDENIWIGMEDMGLNKIDKNTGKVTRFESSPNGLSFNNVHCLLFETDKTLWIGTYTGGINILNITTGKFSYINQQNEPVLPANNIYHIVHSGDSIYIATSAGVSVFNTKTRKTAHFQTDTFGELQVEYIHDGGDKLWFSSLTGVFTYDKKNKSIARFNEFPFLKHTNFVKTDSKNRVWIGDCLEGLCCYNPETSEKMQFNEKNGFPFSWIFSMEEVSDGTFWVSGNKGLVNFNPQNNQVSVFNRESDLPFEQFNFRASFKDSQGNIYFGGNNGMISFNPKNHQNEKKALDVVFRGMQLFNQPLFPGNNKILDKSLNQNPVVRLRHKQNVFTIEFSGLSFQSSGKCQYAYYLEGFEKDWNYAGNRDFATYTNLSPGEYTFHVKASTNVSAWPGATNSLKIIIEPPFWLSNWGFLIYAIIILLILIGFYSVATRIQKSKALAEMERREKEYVTEINNFKLEFFTNVSHELRTPLTLIIAPLTRILEDEQLTPGLIKKMRGIKNNAHRLLVLINQLLEFRKIESGKETLRVSRQNITKLVGDIRESFEGSAKAKDIHLKFKTENLDRDIWIDGMKLENIMINLISNALKFTEKGGKAKVLTKLLEEGNAENQVLFIEVSDTGVGIEPEKKDKIFEMFYKEEMGIVSQNGSGIGLAFVNSLVKLHRGTIEVESVVGKGSVFRVRIPVSRNNYNDQEIVLGQTQFIPELNTPDEAVLTNLVKDSPFTSGKNPVVLVIDDNAELLGFISEMLKGSFEVVTAINGDEGLKKIENQIPDLIISDVMMPGISGLELCRKLKSDIRTSHIPIILLTAKSGEENEYEGLKTGADFYIEKPFFPHILSKMIDNILTTRKSLIERFRSDINMLPNEAATTESDRELIDRITKLIRQHIDKPDLDVTFIIQEIGISRTLLHLKLKNLTGCSATEFIRSIRLREAVKLIADGTCNISEAAYRTGFTSPNYFTRRFKEFFGTSPTQYFEK
jgi:signal transduction histidine kinase/ligand-binding sensor domain-containing protein/DNA-binding response OmpR family regulator